MGTTTQGIHGTSWNHGPHLQKLDNRVKRPNQVAELNPDQKIIFLHCIIHQEVLCICVLKMSHVVDTVTKVVHFIRAKSLNQFVSLLEETESGHVDLPYHTNVRWLSLGKVLKKVWDLKSEIAEFLQMKGKYVDFPQLQETEWLAVCAFNVDIMALMNELNSKLQGKGLFAHRMYSFVKAFKRKLLLLTRQVEANNLTHLLTLLVCSLSDDQREQYTSLLLRALNTILRIATPETIPDFTALVNALQRLHSSH
ncbi:general transcription factor II-I repeat domain-containing protein 2A-like [Oncorhynchus clarkii lewisi]|uniref:general transcription factor II-I repeat domain-containing protein 2A-like n=1 Tax=Oncorhynchus clarkii lewisi TaxID=490388 RepID=UPI0039B9933C